MALLNADNDGEDGEIIVSTTELQFRGVAFGVLTAPSAIADPWSRRRFMIIGLGPLPPPVLDRARSTFEQVLAVLRPGPLDGSLRLGSISSAGAFHWAA